MRSTFIGLMVLTLAWVIAIEWTSSLTSMETGTTAKVDADDDVAKKAAPKPSDDRPAPVDPELAPAIDEILRIRAEHGSPLSGTLLEKIKGPARARVSDDSDATDDADDSFAATLRRVARESVSGSNKEPTLPSVAGATADVAKSEIRPYVVTDDPPAFLGPSGVTEPVNPLPLPESDSLSIHDRWVAQVRATTRILDVRANDLEERRRYDDAHRLRKLANQLRAEARRVEAEEN